MQNKISELLDLIRATFSSLNKNKLRTFLTMLGVIIGVFSVLSLVSLLRGVENFITDQFNALGSNLVLVAPGRAGIDTDPAITYSNNQLDEKHLKLIRENVSDYIVGVSPNIRLSKSVKYKSKQFYASLVGADSNAVEIIDLEITDGRFFSVNEVSTKSEVVIIGSLVKKELFGNTNPIGEKVKMDGTSFEVIGVLKDFGLNSAERVISPYTTLENKLGVENYSGFSIKVKEGQDIDFVRGQVELALLKDLSKDEFSVLTQKDILDSVQNILGILSVGLSAIAAISLIVGGIGIMNIMLVSVNERIREIGLRKALGATSTNIAIQFMSEAVMISGAGGIIGIFLGFFATLLARAFIRAQIPLWALFLAFFFSLLVGVAFGTYPALKASRKDPIEALRYE